MVYIRFVVKILMWGAIVSMVWLTFSCEEFCEESNRTAVVVNFLSSEDDASMTVNITIKGIENDSTLYSKTNLSQVMLPVNPAADFMSFSIIRNDTLPADTIKIHYIRYNGFISSECGCVTFAEIQGEPERTENTITDVVVTSHKVTTVSYRQQVVNEENIRIYY